MIMAMAIAWILLITGDGLSTFLYHVPEHVFGSLHLQTHHTSQRNFRHYAVLEMNLWVLLDGVLGALPYLVMALVLWPVSSWGVVLGLILGQVHVWWRHTTALGWQTPTLIQRGCTILSITTPEQHWQHHQKANTGYGDIFTFLDAPAKVWMRWLRRNRPQIRRWIAQFSWI